MIVSQQEERRNPSYLPLSKIRTNGVPITASPGINLKPTDDTPVSVKANRQLAVLEGWAGGDRREGTST